MRRTFLPFLVLLTSACDPPPPGTTVVASMHAVGTIVSPLMGTEVGVLLPPGVSPHAYEPLPSAAQAAAVARALVAFDPEIDGWITALGGGTAVWIARSGDDPHGWLDPVLVAERLPGLAETLCGLGTTPCDLAAARADSLGARLRELADGSPLAGLRVVLSNNFLTAFAARYGLEVVAIVEPVEGVEPSPTSLRRSMGAAAGADVVVGQAGFPERAAREVARMADRPFVELDPIGRPDSAPTYEDLIQAMIDALRPHAGPRTGAETAAP